MKKQKITFFRIFHMILYMFYGGFIGYLLGRTTILHDLHDSLILAFLLILGIFYLIKYLQAILHECGHLVCGLLGGLRFRSIRFGGLILTRTKDGLRLKRLRVPGTGGSSRMLPAEGKDSIGSLVLYYLGGVIANLLSVPALWALSRLFPADSVPRALLLIAALQGLINVLVNGIPFSGFVSNDGYCVRDMLRDPEAFPVYLVLSRVETLSMSGVRLKDMPPELFEPPEGFVPASPSSANALVLAVDLAMDTLRFSQAEAQITAMLDGSCPLTGYYKGMLTANLIFCRLMRGAAPFELDAPMTGEQARFMRSMRNSPSVLRTEYAQALLRDLDPVKAGKIRARFEKVARAYPDPMDLACERELMAAVDAAAGASLSA